jgi:hypothetical protein
VPWLAALVLGVCCACLWAGTDVEVDSYSRPIQLDGFLLEWDEQEARDFDGDARLLWDAANTKEGLAGYLKTPVRESCGVYFVRLYPTMDAVHRYKQITLADSVSSSDYYRLYQREGDSAAIIAEFLLFWDDIDLDSAGAYRVGMIAYTECGDTLGPLVLQGSRLAPRGTLFTPRMWVQLIVIVVMLTLYVVLYVRIRRRNRRRESPRR